MLNLCIFAKNVENMISREDVEAFLNRFHAKMKVFGIVYRDDRGKNQMAYVF